MLPSPGRVIPALALPALLCCSLASASPASAAPPREHHGVFEVLVSDDMPSPEAPSSSSSAAHAKAAAHDARTARGGEGASELIYRLRDNRGRARRIVGLEGLRGEALPRTGTAVSLYAAEDGGDGGVLMAYGGPAGSPGPTPTQSSFPPAVLGTHRVLVTVVSFSDVANGESIATQSAVWFGPSGDHVAGLIGEASYGRFGITGDVTAVTLTSAMGTACLYDTWASAADTRLRAAGVEPNGYDHVAYILPSSALGMCAWQGLAQLGGRLMWATEADAGTMVHELGHNLGFAHSTDPQLVTVYEYGDSTSFMGRSDALTLDAAHRYQGGWLDAGAVGLFEEDGTYELASLDLPFAGTQQVLVFPHASGGGKLWFLSARTPIGTAGRALWEDHRSGPSLHSLGTSFAELSLWYGAARNVGDTLQVPNEGVTVTHRYSSVDHIWVDLHKSCATFALDGKSEVYATGLGARRFTFRVKNRGCPAGTVMRFDPGTPAAGWSVVASPRTFAPAVGSDTLVTVDVTPSASVTWPAYAESAASTSRATLETGEPGVRFTLDYTAHLYDSAPSAPYRVAIYATTSTSKSLEWYPGPTIARITSYEVWRSLNGGAFAKIGTVTPSTTTTRHTWIDNHGAQATPPAYYITEVDEGGLRSVPSKLVGTVPAGSAPVVANEAVTVAVGQWLEVMVLANDSDPDGQAITLATVGGQANTSAYENGYLRVRFVPRTDRIWIKGSAAGTTALPYEVTDQRGRQTAGTINVTITNPVPTNRPVVTNDTLVVGQGEIGVVDVLANDPVEAFFPPITLCGMGSVSGNARAWIADGRVYYQSFPGRSGADTAYVGVCNALGNRTYSLIDVTVVAGAAVPVANAGVDLVTSDADGDGLGAFEVRGVAVDPDGGAPAVTWLVDVGAGGGGGVIGDEALLEAALPIGTHTVTLVVTDDEGVSVSDDVVVTVLGNRAPFAAAGPDQSAEDEGDGRATVLFDAAGSYDLDGAAGGFTATWSWLEGGAPRSVSGVSTTARLPLGTTTVTLTVRDPGGLTATDTLVVTVVPGTPDTVHVSDLDGTRTSVNASKWRATVTVEVKNDLNQVVSNTTVKGSWSKGSGGTTCTTNASGRCTLTSSDLAKSNVPNVTFTVTRLTKTGLPYAPVDNADPDGDSTGTAITINKP